MEKMISLKDIGKCPYCHSTEYERLSLELFDDAIFTECRCICGNSFEETFRLRIQHWNKIVEVDINDGANKILRAVEKRKR